MITNERRYKITKAQAKKFKDALEKYNELELVKQGIDLTIAAAQRSALTEQLEDLERELAEYEKLRSGEITTLAPASIKEIGEKLIEARVARGLSQRELAELLNLKEQQIQRYEQERYLTANLDRIASISDALSIDLRALFFLVDRKPNYRSPLRELDASKLPIKEMKERGWFKDFFFSPRASSSDLDLGAAFIAQNIFSSSSAPALHHLRVRTGGKFDEYALLAWKARILQKAKKAAGDSYREEPLEAEFTKSLVTLSQEPDGPVQAIQALRSRGIIVVFERHLTSTHLDGAAMMLDDMIPTIGITLRHDRVDNFWFVLMHELAHIVLHRERGLREGFFDESFDEEAPDLLKDIEREADEFAQNALIPNEIWKKSLVRFTTSSVQVAEFARKLKIAPSIVAGRIRRERQNYALFSDTIGQGEVRKMIESAGLMES